MTLTISFWLLASKHNVTYSVRESKPLQCLGYQDTAGKMFVIRKMNEDTSLMKSETNQKTLQMWQHKMLSLTLLLSFLKDCRKTYFSVHLMILLCSLKHWSITSINHPSAVSDTATERLLEYHHVEEMARAIFSFRQLLFLFFLWFLLLSWCCLFTPPGLK